MDYNYEKIVPPRIDAATSEFQTRGIKETVSNELLRKRLEAELRAAEAIGKLKQSIIEKRLAVELAEIEAEYKRRKGGGGGGGGHFFSSSAGQSSKQTENHPTAAVDPRSIFKKTSLWPRRVSNHRSPHRIDSYYKDPRHEARRETVRAPVIKESSHKHMRSLSGKGVPAYEPRSSRLRRDSPYAHSMRSTEDDDSSLQEAGNEEEVAVADPSQSADNTTTPFENVRFENLPKAKKMNNVKDFFKKLRKNSGGAAGPTSG